MNSTERHQLIDMIDQLQKALSGALQYWDMGRSPADTNRGWFEAENPEAKEWRASRDLYTKAFKFVGEAQREPIPSEKDRQEALMLLVNEAVAMRRSKAGLRHLRDAGKVLRLSEAEQETLEVATEYRHSETGELFEPYGPDQKSKKTP